MQVMQRSAELAMGWVSPYRLALTSLTRGVHGDPSLLIRAKETATRELAAAGWSPAR